MASTRKIVVAFHKESSTHEAFACGTGCDGVLSRRIRTRHDPGLVGGAPGVGGDFRSGEIWNDQEGQQEEGEEAGEFPERVRCVANEVKKAAPSCPKPDHRGSEMNKLLIALIAGAFATVAAAQTAAPATTTKEKQKEVQATTGAAAASTTGAQTAKQAAENTAKSKDVSKMTTAEKNQFAKDVNKMSVNPENPSGSTSATAAQQKANTAESKATPKQNTELKTKEGQKALEKDLQKKSTP
jgi:pyruvate/2-oxoglutarate dehydrogenase complex dihydrolipoamide acyltransferase (E2) component